MLDIVCCAIRSLVPQQGTASLFYFQQPQPPIQTVLVLLVFWIRKDKNHSLWKQKLECWMQAPLFSILIPSKGEVRGQAELCWLRGGSIVDTVMALLRHFNVAALGFALTWSIATLLVSRVLLKIFWSVYCFYIVVSVGWTWVGIFYSTILLMSFSKYFFGMVWNMGRGSSFSIWWSNTVFKIVSFSYRVILVPCQTPIDHMKGILSLECLFSSIDLFLCQYPTILITKFYSKSWSQVLFFYISIWILALAW